MLTLVLIGGAPRSGSSAFLKELNQHEDIGLLPEYDLPNVLRSMDALAQKEVFFAKKSWIKNVDRREGSKQKISDFAKFIPGRNALEQAVSTVYQSTLDKKNLRIYGEKYPRHWILDLKPLIEGYCTSFLLITLHRAPSALKQSYEHRTNLTKNGLDMWSFQKPSDSYRHWLLSWLYDEVESIHESCSTLHLKYEDLKTQRSIMLLREALNTEIVFSQDFNPKPMSCEKRIQNTCWLLIELEESWLKDDIDALRLKYNLTYFRKRYWSWVIRTRSQEIQMKIALFPILFFTSAYYRVSRLRHQFRFHRWMLRKVFKIF